MMWDDDNIIIFFNEISLLSNQSSCEV